MPTTLIYIYNWFGIFSSVLDRKSCFSCPKIGKVWPLKSGTSNVQVSMSKKRYLAFQQQKESATT